jgi:hypothetical protein
MKGFGNAPGKPAGEVVGLQSSGMKPANSQLQPADSDEATGFTILKRGLETHFEPSRKTPA